MIIHIIHIQSIMLLPINERKQVHITVLKPVNSCLSTCSNLLFILLPLVGMSDCFQNLSPSASWSFLSPAPMIGYIVCILKLQNCSRWTHNCNKTLPQQLNYASTHIFCSCFIDLNQDHLIPVIEILSVGKTTWYHNGKTHGLSKRSATR